MTCEGCLKVMMFIFNGVIFVAGLAILGMGLWVTVDSSSLLGALSSFKDAPPELAQLAHVGYLLIAVGTVLTVMGFLGCCGAVAENKCMLLTFFIILLIVFIAEVAGAIVVLIFKPVAQEALQKVIESFVIQIKAEYGHQETLTSVINTTMTDLECCGFNNYTDFDGSPFVNSSKLYPQTCCPNSTAPCDKTLASRLVKDVKGCFKALQELIEDNAVLLGGMALGIAALEMAAIIVSIVLYCKIRK